MDSKETAITVGNLLSSKKATDIAMINISEKSSFADYFVNASVGSKRQMDALADEVQDKLYELGYETRGKEGRPDSGWILIDAGDVIVNLFDKEVRFKYALDKIWSDCETTVID